VADEFQETIQGATIGTTDIWIIDASDAFVARFPRVSQDIREDLTRTNIIATADTWEE